MYPFLRIQHVYLVADSFLDQACVCEPAVIDEVYALCSYSSSLQVIGPFIDTKHLLFGDYAPTIMVSSLYQLAKNTLVMPMH